MNSLFGRLMGAHVILLSVIFLSLTGASSYFLEHYFYRAKQRELVANAGKLVQSVESVDETIRYDPNLRATLRTFASFTGSYVWIVDRDGVIVLTAGEENELSRDRLTQEEIEVLREGDLVVQRGVTPDFPRQMLTVALPIGSDGVTSGALFVHAPLIGVNETIQGVRRLLLYSAMIAISLAVVVSWALSRRIASPLAHFTDAVGRIARGEFDIQVEGTRGRDEVSTLGEAFNDMARKLRQTVLRLELESSRVAAVLSSMKDGVVFVNADGAVEMTNEAGAKLLRSGIQVPGEPADSAFVNEEIVNWFRQALHTRRDFDEELTVGKVDYVVKISPVTAEDNGTLGAVGVFRDTSDQRRLERMRRDFVTNISHELRTPLTSIRGFLEAVVDGVARSEKEADEYLRIAIDETDRMRRLAQTLMDLSQIEQGQVLLQRELVHPRRIVMTVLDKLSPQIKEKKLSIHVDLAPHMPKITADPDKMEQVFMNLIDNAVRFSPQGSQVRVVGKLTSDQVLRIEVQDEGPGLDEDEREHIWERFYKVDKSRRLTESGAGLGLAIVKELVELHQGTVGVESELGEGATFFVDFPLAN